MITRSTPSVLRYTTRRLIIHRRPFHVTSTLASAKVDWDKIHAIFERMMWLDVVEINLLNHEIQRRLGLNIELGAVKDTKGAASKEVTAAVEEAKTTVDLKLVSYDEKAKIKVIKEVRAITGLGLKEAKEMVEGAPKVVKKELKPQEAEELKKKLEDVGAQIELS